MEHLERIKLILESQEEDNNIFLASASQLLVIAPEVYTDLIRANEKENKTGIDGLYHLVTDSRIMNEDDIRFLSIDFEGYRRIQLCALNHGYDLTLCEAMAIWDNVNEEYCAGHLCIGDLDDIWRKIRLSFIGDNTEAVEHLKEWSRKMEVK